MTELSYKVSLLGCQYFHSNKLCLNGGNSETANDLIEAAIHITDTRHQIALKKTGGLWNARLADIAATVAQT